MIRFVSPVYFKELAQIAISKQATVLRCVFLGTLLLIFLLMSLAFFEGGGNNASEFGLASFLLVIYGQMLMVFIFTPIVCAGAIAGERQAGTLSLLFLTRLSVWNMVQDKGLSRLTFLTFLVLLTFPFLSGSLLFGGVEFWQVLSGLANSFATVLICGGISLACSTFFKRFAAAIAAAYTLQLLWFTLSPWAIYMLLEEGLNIPSPDPSWWSPVVSVAMMMDFSGILRNAYLPYTCLANIGIGLAAYLAVVGVASMSLRKIAFPGAAAEKGLATGIRALLRPVFAKRKKRLLKTQNPVTWKEAHFGHSYISRVLRWLFVMLFAVYACFLLFSMLTHQRGYWSMLTQPGFHAGWYFAGIAVCGVFTLLMAASAYGTQRESGTFEVLLSTRLGGRQIVNGTIKGIIRSMMPIWIITMLVGLPGAIMEGFFETLTMIFSTLFFLSCLVVLCVTISLKTRSTGHSIGLSMAAMLSIVFLPLLFGMLTFDSDGFEFFAIFTPGTWIVAMPFESHMRREVGGYPVYWIVIFVYALITLALKEGAIKQFDTITGRQEN